MVPAVRPAAAARAVPATMGAAKDGPFTPAVQFARVVLGDKQLLKLRGKAISCASDAIEPEPCARGDCTDSVCARPRVIKRGELRPLPARSELALVRAVCPSLMRSRASLRIPAFRLAHHKALPNSRADHSQYINEFCEDFGVPKKINQGLIKKAKIVGSDLGFLS